MREDAAEFRILRLTGESEFEIGSSRAGNGRKDETDFGYWR